jgi:hypothetical protein
LDGWAYKEKTPVGMPLKGEDRGAAALMRQGSINLKNFFTSLLAEKGQTSIFRKQGYS